MRFSWRAMSGPVFIAQRMEMVRIGDAMPININLRNGEVLRFVCTALLVHLSPTGRGEPHSEPAPIHPVFISLKRQRD